MTPTWYDLLGVEPQASGDEVRAAWKAAIADLDPGDRRFRTLNEAAEILLDPDKRAAYDATLAPDEQPRPQARPGEAAAQLDAPDAPQPEQDSRTTTGRIVPAWLLVVLAVLTALSLTAVGYLLNQPSDDSVAEATTEAQTAAERATPVILAYDYRKLDDDQEASDALLTTDYRKEYDRLFGQIRDNADTVKPIVTAEVVASGIVRAAVDRVVVLVLVDQTSSNVEGNQTYHNQVRVTMEKSDGDWLVDNMDTQPLSP